jgi:hypothetical protein
MFFTVHQPPEQHENSVHESWNSRVPSDWKLGRNTIVGGRRRPAGKIDIAVMQPLSRKGEVDSLVEDDGQVIVDDTFAGN